MNDFTIYKPFELIRPYGFVYFITVENLSDVRVQLLARKWIVEGSDGCKTIVEGEGIVGEKPVLEPGQTFSYNSCHVVGSNSTASGSFFGIIQGTKEAFSISIPSFTLAVPVSE